MIHSYHRDDVPAVLDLYARVHAGDPSVQRVSELEWAGVLSAPHNHGGRDFAVDARDGAIVALLTSAWLDDPRIAGGVRQFRVVVDPAHRRAGRARALLARVEALAEREDAGALQSIVRARQAVGRAALEARGFRSIASDVLLRRDARAAVPELRAIPAEVRLEPTQGAADHAAWAALANAGFARDATGTTQTAESMAAYAAAPGFGLWLARSAAGRPIGFCHVAQGAADVGEIQGLVVEAASEGRGIGAALLARALEALGTRGCTSVDLVTESDNARALRLYARFGFVREDTLDTLRRPRVRRAQASLE